jgi:hypothetical protein
VFFYPLSGIALDPFIKASIANGAFKTDFERFLIFNNLRVLQFFNQRDCTSSDIALMHAFMFCYCQYKISLKLILIPISNLVASYYFFKIVLA